MNKHLLIIVALLFFKFTIAQETDSIVKWEKDFTKAMKKAKKQKKPLLLFFTGSDWCGTCKMLVSDFFNSEKFLKTKAEKFVFYEVDEPKNKDLITPQQRKDNLKLKSKYKVKGLPVVLIVNGRGKEIGRKKGYSFMFRDPTYHFNFIDDTLKKIK